MRRSIISLPYSDSLSVLHLPVPPPPAFVICLPPSLSLSSRLPQRDVTEEEEEEDVDGEEGGGLFEQRFHRRERGEEKWWDDIWNNVCHSRDV